MLILLLEKKHQQKQVRDESMEELHYYENNKNAFSSLYFEQIMEAQKSIKEMWSIYHDSDKEDWNRRLKCLSEIREQAAYLNTLYDYIPDLAGLHSKYNQDQQQRQAPYCIHDEVVKTAKYLKEQEYDDEAIF